MPHVQVEPSGPARTGTRLPRALVAAGASGGAALACVGAGSLAAAAYMARRVVTPDEVQADDVVILGSQGRQVTLGATVETVVPGRYGLWTDEGAGHARVGAVLHHDDETVTRELIAVDRGRLRPGPARWNQYYYWDRPSISLAVPDEDVHVLSELGVMPGWIIRPRVPASGTWAVLVHGRGARKEETLRAVPVLRDAGITSMVVAYRNDSDAPRGPDGRYSLGLSEWRDVDAAMHHAVRRGATRIILCGWSMGGAVALQALANSTLSHRVAGVVLDSAVLDWGDVLRHQARLKHLPVWLASVATGLLGLRSARRLVGVHEAIDVARTDWVSRRAELDRPILLIHSDGDDFVPIGPARELARLRPDIIRFEEWDVARHCREWNYDPTRWERVVREFVSSISHGRAG